MAKMNNMEIKQGDKVMVSKDAPKMYLRGWAQVFQIREAEVIKVEDDNAVIETFELSLAIPTKYLVKVDAEAKEAKFKVGEEMFWLPSKTIRHKCTITEVIKNEHSGKWEYNVLFEWGKPGKWIPESELALYTEPTAPKFKVGDRVKFKNIYELQKVKDKSFRWMLVMFASKEATITAVEDNGFYRVDIDPSIGGINDDMIECKVEPTEQTEAEKPNIGSIKISVEVDLTDSYWDAYAAGLAKELALKVANRYNDPKEAAEYAVSVAKSVVEGLKRK